MADTAESDPQVRRYRYTSPGCSVIVTVVVLGLSGLAVRLATDESWVLPLAVIAPVAVPVLYLFLEMVWSTTNVGDDHLTVRRLLRTRRTAWRDIVAIEIEVISADPNAARRGAQPTGVALVYDRAGRRFLPPGFESSPVASLEEKLRPIRETWESRRGKEWTPLPEAVEGAKADAREGRTVETSVVTAVGRGWYAMRGAFGVLMLVLAIAAVNGWLGAMPSVWAIAGVVAGVFVGVFLGSLAFDRRRGQVQ
ncbi:hypothetical protein [Streptomyces sp. B6B3]|uniref:PH domain-containing protein n=1 Tax=Streptomyces sp. B6B3 TaxID=3153570 RepID=UPI00325D8F52